MSWRTGLRECQGGIRTNAKAKRCERLGCSKIGRQFVWLKLKGNEGGWQDARLERREQKRLWRVLGAPLGIWDFEQWGVRKDMGQKATWSNYVSGEELWLVRILLQQFKQAMN